MRDGLDLRGADYYLSSNFKEVRNLPKDDTKLQARAKGRWYVPDPRKEIDLEKIRHRALMKELGMSGKEFIHSIGIMVRILVGL